MNQEHVFILAGPTGSGKSALAVELAQEIGAEIVSADAFQIYRGLPVLTAQPGPEQLAAVTHHLIGTLEPGSELSAVHFAELAREALADIHSRGKVALVVGGSGFYLNAIFGRGGTAPPPPPGLREELAGLPAAELLQRLLAADPEAAALVDQRNPRRVQRALEIVISTGRPFSAFAPAPAELPPGIVLNLDREELRRRIDRRAETMLQTGAIEEVAALGEISVTCSQIIGLREIQRLLAGEITTSECLDLIRAATWQYARRQMTWFRNKTSWPPVLPEEARDFCLRNLRLGTAD